MTHIIRETSLSLPAFTRCIRSIHPKAALSDVDRLARITHKVYQQTSDSALPFLLIGRKLLNKTDLFKNFGLVGQTPICEQHLLDKRGLAILGEQQWSITANQAFLLGGLNTGKEFQLVERNKLQPPDLLSQRTQRLTVFAQELLMLQKANCKRQEIQLPTGISGGTFFICEKRNFTAESLFATWIHLEQILEENKDNASCVHSLMDYAGLKG